MLETFRTLITGANARAEERVRDTYAVELIEQKIREAQSALEAAKGTLASLIQRRRSEDRLMGALDVRISDLTKRAKLAIEDENAQIAEEAAEAIAQLENERAIRRETLDRLTARITRLQSSVEAAHRRIIDLRQGAITARAMRQEQNMQRRLVTTRGGSSAAEEAEALIARVIGADDPFEESEILSDINKGLNHETLADRMAAQGYGKSTKTTGADVLARLKTGK